MKKKMFLLTVVVLISSSLMIASASASAVNLGSTIYTVNNHGRSLIEISEVDYTKERSSGHSPVK